MNLEKVLQNLHTTHTFGGSKSWGNNKLYPYKQILIDGRSILSQRLRHENDEFISGEPRRTMTKAKKFGLDDYVFAYLGNHEHYYSSTNGSVAPPFGIFFSDKLDYKDTTNATRYDLQSPHCETIKGKEFYDDTKEARADAHTRILNTFNGDFFGYWVCPDYEAKNYYDHHSWEWKVEFHYHRKVDMDGIEAILWPVLYELKPAANNSVVYIVDVKYEFYRKQFINDPRNKGINVYPYAWNGQYSIERFSYASYLITRHFTRHGRYPDLMDFQMEYARKFPPIS